MEIKFEKTSAVAAELTIVMEKSDYQEQVEKALKDYRKKALLPGFRKGQVPLGLLRKRFGTEITQEEVQKLLSEKLYGYLREEKVDMLGDPLASEKQQAIDFEADSMQFIFDIALRPEFDATLSEKDELPFYNIEVTEQMVDNQVQAYRQRGGSYQQADTFHDGDMVKGHLAELDEQGNIKEGGLQKEDAVILPGYFKNDDQKKKFAGLTPNTAITFNPAQAYENSAIELATLLGISKEEAANVRGDFSYQVTEITRYTPAELTQDFFDQVFGEGQVKSEEEFRARVKEQMEAQFAEDSDYRLLIDVREYLEKRIGDLEWPDALLKRIMRANNPDKDESYIEENYPGSIKELLWHLIKEQLADQTGIKVEQGDVLETAKAQTRAQFAQYGMAGVPEELITKYAQEQMQKREQAEALVARTVERKLRDALKTVVKLQPKVVSFEEFQKLFEKQ